MVRFTFDRDVSASLPAKNLVMTPAASGAVPVVTLEPYGVSVASFCSADLDDGDIAAFVARLTGGGVRGTRHPERGETELFDRDGRPGG